MKKLLAGAAALISVLLPLFAFEGSPVADAAANRDFAAVKTLLAQKADVNAAQADGSTALHWAVYWNNAEAVDLLLKAGADTKAATRLNATPLYVAAENGNAVMIQKLLAADVRGFVLVLAGPGAGLGKLLLRHVQRVAHEVIGVAMVTSVLGEDGVENLFDIDGLLHVSGQWPLAGSTAVGGRTFDTPSPRGRGTRGTTA